MTVTTATATTYKIPTVNLPALTKALAKLTRKVARHGFAPITVEQVDSVTERVEQPDGSLRVTDYAILSIVGSAPHHDGWTFIATIDHTNETGNIVRTLPGEQCPAYLRDGDSAWCDHCQTARRRNETFVLRHRDGTHCRVGRNCLGDFLGGVDPHGLAAMAEALAAADEMMGGYEDGRFGSRGGEMAYPIADYLAYVAGAISRKGWLSRTKARESYREATADFAWFIMTPLGRWASEHDKQRKRAEQFTPSAEEAALGERAAEWAAEWTSGGDLNDYQYNVRVCIMGGVVTARTAGIVGSVVAVYQREMEKRSEATVARSNEYVGTPGARQEFTVTYTDASGPFESDWGQRFLLKFADTEGNYLGWWTTNPPVPALVVGTQYRIKATVKAHTEYKGRKQTMLTRVTVK